MDTNADFLGAGWGFPPTFSNLSYTVTMVSDDLDIQQSLYILFSTSLGERLMVPQYGSALDNLVFQNLTTSLITRIKNMVSNAVLFFEPRIDVTEVNVQQDLTNAALVLVQVVYTIRRTNTRSNMVYPFYLSQNTIPAKSP